MDNNDLTYLRRCIELAENGRGFVNPNPMVGAIIVKNGVVIGEGWHRRYGGPHAEAEAISRCNGELEGATMYLSLEPCCHHGKRPPCTDLLIAKKISRVVVGMIDPNPKVSGEGIAILRRAGIRVDVADNTELTTTLKKQNRVFLKYITSQYPFVIIKSASSLDGKIATCKGESKWITGVEARNIGHVMRHEYMAIVIGYGTAVSDNPMLTCRPLGKSSEEIQQPIRIIVDSRGRLSLDSNLVRSAKEYRTIVAHTALANSQSINTLKERGVETLLCNSNQYGKVSLTDLCVKLHAMKIDSLLVEGGGELNFAFLEAGLVDEMVTFIAPKIIGGSNAKTSIEGEGFPHISDAVMIKDTELSQVGVDIMIRGCVSYKIDK